MKRLLQRQLLFLLFILLSNISIKAQKDSTLYFGKDSCCIVTAKIHDTHVELNKIRWNTDDWNPECTVKFPDLIDGKPITVIAPGFYNCGIGIVNFHIPSTIEQIGNNAFRNAYSVNIIDLSKSAVKMIGDYAFADCEYLSFDGTWNSVTLPETVEKIGIYCFASNRFLHSVTLSPILATIPDNAFAKCTELSECILPASLESIGKSSFYGTNVDVTLPSGIKTIGDLAFAHTHLSRITIPNTVTQIGKEAFTNCHYLKEVSFENGCKISTIENNTFQDCDRLTKVTLPNTIVRIGDYAFEYCI